MRAKSKLEVHIRSEARVCSELCLRHWQRQFEISVALLVFTS